MNNEKDYKFQKLTPYSDADLEVYDKAFEYVFNNSDIKNIAISGIYGSGKSSIMETFEKNDTSNRKYIHISLAHFAETSLNNNKITENSIEGKILNQLIQQIEPKYIPQTRFKVKRNISNEKVLVITFISILTILGFIFLFNFINWKNFVITSDIPLLYITISVSFRIATLVWIVIIFGCVLYILIQSQLNNHLLKKITIKGSEIEIFEENDESYFDKYLNEVIYIFENCQADCIIFEDIDRFNDTQIFENLREINTLVNYRLKKEDSLLRFFYLLRDDVFQNKDRTKFFDFVIPVIPIVNSSNAYNILIESFNDTKYENSLDHHFLHGISLYLDDFRIIKNILNEFYIYEKKLNTIELDCNKLLAIIVYKNIFPKDFSDLLLNKGYVYSLFNNKSSLIKIISKSYKDKLEKINKRLEFYKNEFSETKKELDYIKEKKEDEYPYIYQQDELNSWIENSYKPRLQAIEDRNNNLYYKIVTEKDTLEEKIKTINNNSLKNLLINSDIINSYFHDTTADNDIGVKNEFNEIKASDYFDLLKYLVVNGFIDETYTDYLSYFYENSLSINDKKFLRSITDRNALEETYKLDNPKLVLENLNTFELSQVEARNYDLFEYVLEDTDQQNIKSIIKNVCSSGQHSFIKGFMKNKPYNKLIKNINIVDPIFINSMFQSNDYIKDELETYCMVSLQCNELNILSKMNEDSVLANWIANDDTFMNETVDNSSLDQVKMIIKSLIIIDVHFVSIHYTDATNTTFFNEVYKNNLYVLNANNLKLMLDKKNNDINKSCLFTHVYNENETSPLFKYMKENMGTSLKSYFDIFSDSITDTNETIYWIISHSEINNDLKEKYIDQLGTYIEDINKIEDESMKLKFLVAKKIRYSVSNILSYSKLFGLNNELTVFINSNPKSLDYTKANEPDIIEDFARNCFKQMELNDIKYEQILTSIVEPQTNFNFSNMTDNKLTIAIKNHIIPMNSNNIDFIRKQYYSHLELFILNNFKEYINYLSNNQTTEDEIKMLLLSNSLDETQKIIILKSTSVSIHLDELNVSNSIKLEIIENHFDVKDFSFVISSYENESNDIKEAIIQQIITNFSMYVRSENTQNKIILFNLLSNNKLTFDQKAQLFEKNINILNNGEIKECLYTFGAEKIIFNLFNNSNHKVEYNSRNNRLVEILESADIIEPPYKAANEKYYKKLKLKKIMTKK